MQKLCNDLGVLVFTERADPPVCSEHISEGSLMSQSVSLRALEDVQAYFSKNIYITIKDCRPLTGVLKAVLT